MLRTVGRNKPVHGRFWQEDYPDKRGLLRRKRPPGRAYSGLHLASCVTSVNKREIMVDIRRRLLGPEKLNGEHLMKSG